MKRKANWELEANIKLLYQAKADKATNALRDILVACRAYERDGLNRSTFIEETAENALVELEKMR